MLLPFNWGIATVDPHIRITDCGGGWVRYRNDQGKEWIIRGQCNCCGQCEEGTDNPNLIWTGKPIGSPGACLDKTFGKRRDVPVSPEINRDCPACTLKGEYL